MKTAIFQCAEYVKSLEEWLNSKKLAVNDKNILNSRKKWIETLENVKTKFPNALNDE